MELLKIHPQTGQWELVKAARPPYSSPEGGISTPRENEPGNDFKAYRSTTGQLTEDHDTKGQLHGQPGNKRAPKQGQARRNWSKVPTLLPSSAANSNPGLGV